MNERRANQRLDPDKDTRTRRRYPSDLSDRQWETAQRLLGDEVSSRRALTPLREVCDGINYRWSTGCSWRMLPHDFPPWPTVYFYFHRWMKDGTLAELRSVLLARQKAGRRLSNKK